VNVEQLMETRPLTAQMKPDRSALGREEYERSGGYVGARKALAMTPKEVQQVVIDSNLRGRGGAGFPTGQKWSFVPMGPGAARPKYLIANADEMEPGTFKDRLLLESNPHQVIEGMIISAYAIEAEIGYVFMRGEYTGPAERVRRALAEAYEAGYLGKNAFGTEYRLDIYLHPSAGRYICGEETGLLNALEGKRANPRSKPPFPQVSGLFGKPTIVQNTETLCNIPHILRNGIEWYKGLSKSEDAGTKLYGASGRVRSPAIWELPLGVTIRELLYEHAGGMADGYAFRGLLPGGASTDFLIEQHLDTPMTYGAIQKAGSRLGTGTMIVLDDKNCPVGMVRNLEHFFAQESCGWCTPCREGLPWTAKLLDAIEEGRGEMRDLDLLGDLCRWIGPPGRTFCALAPGAMEPLQSALKFFRDDFVRHIEGKSCPWR